VCVCVCVCVCVSSYCCRKSREIKTRNKWVVKLAAQNNTILNIHPAVLEIVCYANTQNQCFIRFYY